MATKLGAHASTSRLITPTQVDRIISSSPRILAAGMAKAKVAQTIWQGHAPVFDPSDPREKRKTPPHGQPEDYKKSIRITVIRRHLKIAWRVGTNNYLARWIEFGAKHMPKKAPREKTLAEMKHGGGNVG